MSSKKMPSNFLLFIHCRGRWAIPVPCLPWAWHHRGRWVCSPLKSYGFDLQSKIGSWTFMDNIYIYIYRTSRGFLLLSTVDSHLAVVTWETCFSFLWVPCTFRSRPSDDWQQFRTCQTPWNALSGLIDAVCTSKMTSADTVAARACEADSPMDH